MSNIVKELEFRNSQGNYLFDVRGVFAQSLFCQLILNSELVKRNKTFKDNKTFQCLVNESKESIGLISGGIISFILEPKAYIKIIT